MTSSLPAPDFVADPPATVASVPEAKAAPASRRVAVVAIVVGALIFIVAQIGFVRVNAAIDQLAFNSTATVDMAGFQRTLTQRILGSALLMQTQQRNHNAVISSHAELVAAEHIFDATLSAFTRGGTTENSAGAEVTVDALQTPAEVAIASDIAKRWQKFHGDIDALGNFEPSHAAVNALAKSALTITPQLSVLMNDLSAEVEQTAQREIGRRSAWRNELIALAVLGLLLVVVGLFLRVIAGQRQVRRFASDLQGRNEDLARTAASLSAAKAQEDLIMQTVRQGLFLVDDAYRIQGEYSKELESIFRESRNLAGTDLLGILQPLVPPKVVEVSKDYLGLLFDRSKRERLLLDVNPLDQVEVNFPNPEGGFTARHLAFSFRRIVSKKRVVRVFIAVSDITDRVTLERQLRESEKRKERQFEMLLGILAVDPATFEDFLATANEQVAAMSETLRSQQNDLGRGRQRAETFRERLDSIFGNVHNIKGNAALLQLDYFVRSADAIELKIGELRARPVLEPDDFIALLVAQSRLREDLDEAREVREQLTTVARPVARPIAHERPPVTTPLRASVPAPVSRGPLEMKLQTLARVLANEAGKRVNLSLAGMESDGRDRELEATLGIVLPELVRYSVAYGVETPERRRALGKDEIGRIAIERTGAAGEGDFTFTYRDDGCGLDARAIRRRAVERGLCTAEIAERANDSEVMRYLFVPEFHGDSAATDARREPDLRAVKRRIIDEACGEMRLDTVPGEYMAFTFKLRSRVAVLR